MMIAHHPHPPQNRQRPDIQPRWQLARPCMVRWPARPPVLHLSRQLNRHPKWHLNWRALLIVLLLPLLLLPLAACQAGAPASQQSAVSSSAAADTANSQATRQPGDADNLTFVTSVYPLYVAALNLAEGVPGVKVENLTGTVTGCLHDYQLTPRNLQTLEKASVFIVNGAGLEGYLEQLAQTQPDLVRIDASEGIALLDDNPHVWVSISLMIRQVGALAAGLARFDPAHADQYAANAAAYTGKLEQLRTQLHARLDALPARNMITFHEAFPYFAQEFNLQIAGVVEREPDSQPSAAELAETIELIRRLKVRAIFVEPQYAKKTADTIARETGATIYTLDPAASGPLHDKDAYLRIMQANGDTLVTALGAAGAP